MDIPGHQSQANAGAYVHDSCLSQSCMAFSRSTIQTLVQEVGFDTRNACDAGPRRVVVRLRLLTSRHDIQIQRISTVRFFMKRVASLMLRSERGWKILRAPVLSVAGQGDQGARDRLKIFTGKLRSECGLGKADQLGYP